MRYNTRYSVSGISGDPSPSQADITVTRDLIRAGQILKVEVLDHIVMLSKRLDKKIYAECWIMPSWRQPSVRFRVKTGWSPDQSLG